MENILNLVLRDLPEGLPPRQLTIAKGETYTQRCKSNFTKDGDVGKIGPGRKKEIIEYLFVHFSGKCHWCKKLVYISENNHRSHKTSTIDHLKTKRMGRRNYYEGGHVLSCYHCNHQRGHKENLEYQPLDRRMKLKILSFD